MEKYFHKTAQNIFCFLYIICPYFFIMAGISFDCDLIIPVFVVCMSLAEKCLETGETRWYLLLGISVAMLSYSYIIGTLMVPLFLLIHFLMDKQKKKVLLETAIAFVIDIPIGYYILTLLELVPQIRTGYFTIAAVSKARLGDVGFSLDNLFKLRFLIITDPDFNFAGSSSFGTIYQISLLFFVIGCIFVIRDRRHCQRFFAYLPAAFVPLLLIRNATSYNYTILYFFLLVITAVGIESLFHRFKTLGVLTIAGYIIMFGFFCREYFTAAPFIYSDAALIPVIAETGMVQKIMLDTTGVIQPECYIGIALEADPGMIQYDSYNNAVSFGNIKFNDSEHYLDYDVAILRNKSFYLYQPYMQSGLSDAQVRRIAEDYVIHNYKQEEKLAYYIYRASTPLSPEPP